jgi:uncharacterized membrane protein (UPF0182 family)
MLPFTPARKDNLAAWMVARSDGDRYGQLEVFEFPKQKIIYGPRQIIARINQDQVISPQITLWNQQGSQVIQGTLLVIPVEEALLYVRPLYLRASGGRIPELSRVIVAYRDQIVMAEVAGCSPRTDLRRRHLSRPLLRQPPARLRQHRTTTQQETSRIAANRTWQHAPGSTTSAHAGATRG